MHHDLFSTFNHGFIVFLIFTLIIGLYYSRKTTTLKEYAIGHKNFTTATLVATVLATAYGGGELVRNVQQVHAQGLYWILLMFLNTLTIWILIPLSTHMTAFMENLSITETDQVMVSCLESYGII